MYFQIIQIEEAEVFVDVLEEDKKKERLHIKALLLTCIFSIFMLNYGKWWYLDDDEQNEVKGRKSC